MKISLNNTEMMEGYINGTLSPADKLLFDAALILDPALQAQLRLQKDTYLVVKAYSRIQLRSELNVLSAKLSAEHVHKPFWSQISNIFNR
jgi:hypothetical protein